jgi:uncharacterized protein (DUF1800 family)
MKYSKYLSILSLVLLMLGCGGSKDENTDESLPSPTVPPSTPPVQAPTPELPLIERQQDAARLLTQASFGATTQSIDAIAEQGVEAWINLQLSLRPTKHLDYFRQLTADMDSEDIWREHRMEAWWHSALYADDQLRQRVAFALSELFVVSDRSFFAEDFPGILTYYDILVMNAFGNYRDLLEEVTLSPIMGMYLSMLANEKPNTERNIRPDENFAREVMQLFSIGLVALNQDGSPTLDSDGNTIATYGQAEIEGFAHVFTGWNFGGTTQDTWYNFYENYDTSRPMQAVDAYHDKNEKVLLNGLILPANQSAEQDLTMALDSLFNHPNVAPFVAKHLIQRLITSNPTPNYIERVSAVFNNNGQNERGDLAAVIKAVLLDEEARQGHQRLPEQFGKLKEPIIKATQLWRAFDAQSTNQRVQLGYPEYFFNQSPMGSPSVFNFFLPDYTTPGELTDAGLVAPELQIMTESFAVRATNFMAYTALWRYVGVDYEVQDIDILVDYAPQVALINDTEALIEHLNLLLMAGQMSEGVKEILSETHEATAEFNANDRIANLVFLIMSSPQFAVQR